jgi:hypothetical protein
LATTIAKAAAGVFLFFFLFLVGSCVWSTAARAAGAAPGATTQGRVADVFWGFEMPAQGGIDGPGNDRGQDIVGQRNIACFTARLGELGLDAMA